MQKRTPADVGVMFSFLYGGRMVGDYLGINLIGPEDISFDVY